MSCEICRASRSTESIEVTLKRSFCFTGGAPWESYGIPIHDLCGPASAVYACADCLTRGAPARFECPSRTRAGVWRTSGDSVCGPACFAIPAEAEWRCDPQGCPWSITCGRLARRNALVSLE